MKFHNWSNFGHDSLQKNVHFFFSSSGALAVWIGYFIISDANWKCASNSSSCILNDTLPYSYNHMCHINRTEGFFLEDIDASIKSHFQLQCGKNWLAHLAASILFAGWAISSLFVSGLADRFGRKVVLFTSLLVLLSSGLILAFSTTIEMFVVFRFLMGIAIPGLFQVAFIMLGEITDSKNRVLFINIFQTGQTIALILLGLVASFVNNWRTLILLTTCPFALVLITWKTVPESLYWLVLKGRQREFISVISKISYWNTRTLPDRTLTSNFAEKKQHSSRLLGLFQSWELKLQTSKALFCWLVIGMVYYGIGMAADDLTGAFYRDFVIVRSMEIPANICGIYASKRFGRKKLVTINVMFASVACILVGAVPPTGNIRFIRLILGIVGTFCTTLAFHLNIVWTMELYGTDLRSNAMGASNFTSRLGGALAPWIIKELKHCHPDAPFYLIGGLGIFCAALLLSLHETKNTPMKNMIDDVMCNEGTTESLL